MDVKQNIMNLPYGEYTVFATVGPHDWGRTSQALLSRFSGAETNKMTRTLSFTGNKDQLLDAANAGLYGITAFKAFNSNTQRQDIVSQTARSITGMQPL